MKLNLHRSFISIYVPLGDYDSFKKIFFFEDLDETFINYNARAKIISYEHFLQENNNFPSNYNPKTKNFFKNYF